jgi:SAM-dependent methyltransferase
MSQPTKTVGVIGGLGPLATLDFFERVLRRTRTYKEEDHLRLLIDNNTKVPDRNAFGRGEGPSPAPALAASAKGLETAGADFIVMGYALRHIADLAAAFAEFHRVLKPGGRLLVLEITKPAGALATSALKLYMRGVVPLLARFVSRGKSTPMLWRYYWDTIEACAAPEAVVRTLAGGGLAQARREVALGIFSEYLAIKP